MSSDYVVNVAAGFSPRSILALDATEAARSIGITTDQVVVSAATLSSAFPADAPPGAQALGALLGVVLDLPKEQRGGVEWARAPDHRAFVLARFERTGSSVLAIITDWEFTLAGERFELEIFGRPPVVLQ